MNTLPHHALQDNPIYIYALVDPRDITVHYIGISSNLYARFKQHMRCDGTNAQKDAWIQDLKASGHLMIMQTLEQVSTNEQAREREEYWIHQCQGKGIPLLNRDLTPSVDSIAPCGRKHTSEQIDDLLRYLVIYGKLPSILKVSKRTEYMYRHHPRLEAIRQQVKQEQKKAQRQAKRKEG